MLAKKMFSWKWLFTTLLVFAGTAVCIRLGVWQLDRLEQRRLFNAQVESMRAAEVLDLNQSVPSNIEMMEWREVTVTGEYDFENQIALRNRYHNNQDEYGYDLITPLRFDGQAILVDRGWIPADGNAVPADWHKYDESGSVTLTGQLRLGQDKPAFGGVADAELTSAQSRLDFWNNLNVTRMSEQIPYPVLPVFVQPEVNDEDTLPPIPSQPVLELTEGSHLGYAFQWFSFAAILFIGYPFYLRKQE
jgi:surfeit locus 1 family protein